MVDRYRKYSKYLVDSYGEKVYKLPINLPLTCPNRDGEISTGGCSFCGDIGTGFESLSNRVSVKEQLETNSIKIKKKYKAFKFIAYFQNFTNTYLPLEDFRKYLEEAVIDDVVEICVSSRPDCINDSYLDILKEIQLKHNINISVELGLQSINHKTLKKINRGHTLAEFVDSVIRIKKYKFKIGVHLILNLPWDDLDDIIETAKLMTALDVDLIKIHSLYILKNTKMAKEYENKEFIVDSVESYVQKVVEFIRYTQSNIGFMRLLARAPEENTIFCNWNMSWWKIHELIENRLDELNAKQGDKCNYLNGKAVKKFL